jgi:transposase
MKTFDDLHTKTAKELQAMAQEMEQRIAGQNQTIAMLEEANKTLDKAAHNQKITINECYQLIESLRHQLNNALRNRFGQKSEKSNLNQPSLFDEVIQPENTEEITQVESEITVVTHQRKKTGRKPIAQDLLRVQKIHDLPESEKTCACGCTLSKIGEQTTEQLDFIPAKAQVIQHVRYKYACKTCDETIKTAKGPNHPIPKSIASPGLLAHIAVSKFCDHLPLYRMEDVLQRMGVDIARNTLSHWMIKISEVLLPIYKLLQYQITTYDIAYGDETPVQVLKEPDRPPESKSYMWCFIGGPPEKRSIVYHYDIRRSHLVPLQMLEDFKGWLHCDGHSAYDTYAKVKQDVILLGCWMHARRKFYDVAKTIKTEGLAHKAVKKIGKLYHIESELKQQGALTETIYEYRQQHAKPVLKEFKQWLDENSLHIRPKSPLGEAFGYALNQWGKLTRYIDDGRLEMDNGESERKIKPFVIGRKNWLFCHSVAGAKAAEIIYSIIETAKHHHVEPYSYLRYVLTQLPYATTEADVEALLPFNVDRTLLTIS